MSRTFQIQIINLQKYKLTIYNIIYTNISIMGAFKNYLADFLR